LVLTQEEEAFKALKFFQKYENTEDEMSKIDIETLYNYIDKYEEYLELQDLQEKIKGDFVNKIDIQKMDNETLYKYFKECEEFVNLKKILKKNIK